MGKGKRNRKKNAVPALPKEKKDNSVIANTKIVAEQFHGPIPHPSILNEYEKLLPGSADRILSMAEKETQHRHKMETKAIDAEIEGLKNEASDTKRGQYFGLVIGVIAIISGAYTSIHGYPWPGTFFGAGGVVGLVSAFIAGRKSDASHDRAQHPKQIDTT